MTDMETGYKLIKTDALKNINIQEKSFGIEPEITIKLAKKNLYFMKFPYHMKEDLMSKVKKLDYRMPLLQSIVFLNMES